MINSSALSAILGGGGGNGSAYGTRGYGTNPNGGSTGGGVGGAYGQVANGVGGAYDWLNSNKGSAAADQDRAFLAPWLKQNNGYISSTSSQQPQANALVSMLMDRANGVGPSVAGDAYNQASANAMNNAIALSHGNSAGASRAALQQIGNVNQGLAQGYASARNQEMSTAAGQAGAAITGADNLQLQRDKANQQAWLQMLDEKTGLTKSQIGAKDPTNGSQIGSYVTTAAMIAAMLA